MDMNNNLDELPIIDWERFSQLCQDMGEEKGSETINMMLEDYFSDAARLLSDCRKGFGEADTRLYQRSAHTLKSTSAMFGAKRLSALCKAMEERGKNGVLDGAAEHIAQAEIEFEKAKTSLSA